MSSILYSLRYSFRTDYYDLQGYLAELLTFYIYSNVS